MPIFTIETTCYLPIHRQRTFESGSAEEACRLALEDDDWKDYESRGPTFVSGAWSGNEAYAGEALQIPQGLGKGSAISDTIKSAGAE